MRLFTFAATVVFACVAASLPGQQPADDAAADAAATPTLSVQAKLVVVPVVVRDKHGALVGGLTRDNFALQIDGVAQPVRYFDHDADLPLTVGLLVDTSMSQRDVLDDERRASVTFIQKMLAPERDKAFVIQFAGTVDLLADVTNSRPKLQSALQELDATPQRPSGYGAPDHGGDPHPQHHGGGTALYDAVYLSADEVASKQQGRRAFILLTDGGDNGSKETLGKAIEAAQRADTVVYAIYYKGEEHGGWGGDHHGYGFPGGGPGGGHYFQYPGGHGHSDVDGKKVLERMCGETGGRVFEVSKKETVEKIYAEIGEELRSQFRLGFTPTASAAAAGYHKVSVTLVNVPDSKKDQVQTRDGYYTGKP